jgi:hypothetical protein
MPKCAFIVPKRLGFSMGGLGVFPLIIIFKFSNKACFSRTETINGNVIKIFVVSNKRTLKTVK